MLKRSISNYLKKNVLIAYQNVMHIILKKRVVALDILPTNVAANGDIIDPILDTVDAIPRPTLLQ